MKVTLTKTGKYRVTMEHALRVAVWELLLGFLQDESTALLFVSLEKDVDRHLYASVLGEMLNEKSFALHANWETRILLKKSQAIALVWLLRDANDFELLNLKSELYKLIC